MNEQERSKRSSILARYSSFRLFLFRLPRLLGKGVIHIKNDGYDLSETFMTEDLAFKAANYYAEGLSFRKISEKMGIATGRVGNLIREGIFSMVNDGVQGVQEEPEQVNEELNTLEKGIHSLVNEDIQGVQEESEQVNDEVNIPGEKARDLNSLIDGTDFDDAFGKSILIQATPIIRKVVLNSKVYLQHEYFKEKLGYEGDIGDLLVEALEFYWKEMGFKITITQDSVM